MKFLAPGMLFSSVNTAFAQPDPMPHAPNRPTLPHPPRVYPTEAGEQITRDLLEFVDELNNSSNSLAVQHRIYGARIGLFGANVWMREWKAELEKNQVELRIDEIKIQRIDGDAATARVMYSFSPPRGLKNTDIEAVYQRPRREIVTLQRAAKAVRGRRIWQIVPPDEAPTVPEPKEGDDEFASLLATLSFQLAQKQPTESTDARAKRSLVRLERLCLATRMSTIDYDGHFHFAPEYAREALWPYVIQIGHQLQPYVPNEEVFKVPGGSGEYGFNVHLSDSNSAQIKAPAQTVLFYEGVDETPVFRYDGQAAIGFVDGHAALISREEAATLVWKP